MPPPDFVKLVWKDKAYKKIFDAAVEQGLEEGGFRVLASVQKGIQEPGRGRLYDHPRVGPHRASEVGQALKSPTGELLNSMQMESGRVPLGLGVRVGIGPEFQRFAVIGRQMMLGRKAQVKGQRPTLRPPLEKEWPKIVKSFQLAAKRAK